ncbi:MAG: glycoside hydrolase family 3 domain protein [Paenibacillaceae bacterium]|jgi:hypothetical protein|nr:glycoside hydrolase family 3 domain protein [Paenibacillaceae bacterium]
MKVRKWMKKTALWVCMMSLALGAGIPGVIPAPLAHAAEPAVLTVDASTVIAPMKEEMRGTNIGLWTRNEFHPVSGRTEQYVNMIKEAGISLIRFPAGAEADYAYWDRTNSYEWHVGPSPYIRTITAGIFDSYMDLVREVGAEAMVTVNTKIDNKEMAADMVRYANLEKGYHIKYWEIGNEPEFFASPYNVTPLEYAARIKEYSEAMKAVDPGIIIMGPANAQPTQFEGWTKPILSYLHDNGAPVDAISTHWYPLWGGQTNTESSSYPSIDNLLAYDGPDYANSYMNWAGKFTDTTPTDNLVSYRDTYTDGALIGITELGQVTGGSEGAGIGNTMAGALWLGDVLGRLAYHQMDFVTQFLLQGNQAYGLMDMNKNVRPAYYLYPMLKRYFGNEMVETSSSDNQNFTIWASKRAGEEDKLYLMVINKHQTDSLNATVNLSGFVPEEYASSWTLNAPSINSVAGANINNVQIGADGTLPEIGGNIVTGVSDSFTREYPAHSVTMIELSEAGTADQTPARFLGQFAANISERKAAGDWPGSLAETPQGWGKIYRTGKAGWTVHLPKSGEYSFAVRAYGEGDAPNFQVRLNGQDVPDAAFVPGSSWDNYQGSLGTVEAGSHTLEILNNSPAGLNNINVAHIEIVGAAPGPFILASPADSTTVESTVVTLDWTQSVAGRTYQPFGADSYTLVVADNPEMSNPVLHTTVQSTSHEISTLEGKTTYYWTVTAFNANGATPAESTFSFTTPVLIVPSEPARYLGQYATGMNERKLPADWPGSVTQTPQGWGKIWRTATTEWPVYFPVSGEYQFALRAFGEGEAPAFQVKVDGQPLEGASFTPGTGWSNFSGSLGTVTSGLHFVQITNTSPSGVSNIGIAHMDIMGAAPGKFTLKSPANHSQANSTTVTLDWTQVTDGRAHAPFGADQYKVIVADNAALNNPAVSETVTGTVHQVEHLEGDTTYYWTVIAGNANGTTRAVAPFSFTTPSHYVPVSPARYLGQFADTIQERRTSANYPGTSAHTPQGWGKVWRFGTGQWKVNFPAAGTYAYKIKAYGEGATASFQVQLDGADVPNAAYRPGGSWTEYQGNISVPAAGTYILGLYNNSETPGHNVDVAHIDIMGAAPAPFVLTAPGNNETVNTPTVTLDWTQTIDNLPFAPLGAVEYHVVVADNAQFNNPVVNATTAATTYNVNHLFGETTYYWRVEAANDNGLTLPETAFRFTTGDFIQPSLATITGPASALVGQAVDYGIGVSMPESSFTIMEAVVSYDPSRIQFATTTDLESRLILAEQAITAVQPGFYVLATGVRADEGLVYILLGRAGGTEPVNGGMFTLHGSIKGEAPIGTATVSLNQATVSADGDMTLLGTAGASVQTQVALADKTQLTAAITTAANLLAAAVPGNQPGQYPTAAVVAFQTAINSAAAVRDNSGATQAQVSAAITALQTATATFRSSVIPPLSTDKTTLNQTIQKVEAKLGSVTEGTKIGQYPASAMQELEAALQTAQAVSNNAGAGQSQVNGAVTALNEALSAFSLQIISLIPGQGAITIRDLSIIAKYYGTTSEDEENWPFIEKADLFDNGEISIVELAAVARMLVAEWLED